MAEAALKQPEGIDTAEVEAIAGGPIDKPADKTESTVDPKVRAPKPEKVKDEQPKTVPHEALHAERVARQAAEKRLKDFEKEQSERNTRLEERLARLYEAREAPQQPKVPDLARNPLEFVRQQDTRLQSLETKLTERDKVEEHTRAQAAEFNKVWGSYGAAVKTFRAEQPDNDAAVSWLADFRRNQLRALEMEPNEIEQDIAALERQIVFQAHAAGKDPAKTLYQWAVATGWKPEMAQRPNGAQKPVSEIDRLTAAQEASETLSKGGSASATAGRMTIETLYRMSDTELNAFILKMNSKDPEGFEKLSRRLHGG